MSTEGSNKKRERERKKERRKKENKALANSPPMDGGVGKCGQNAGDVMEREIFRSSRRRLTARERFGAPPFERDDRLGGGEHAGGNLPLS